MIAWLLACAGAAPPAYVEVLGIAQDAGHPQAGCEAEHCRAAWADPSLRHRVASLAIVDGEHRLIVDATPDLPDQLHDLGPGAVPAILLTHAHIGHYTGLVHLGREVMGAKAVPVYAMPRMRAFLEGNGPWSQLVELGNIELRPAEDGVELPRVRITAFTVPHRDEYSETVGYRIAGPTRTVVWLPDIDKWERWSTPVEDLVRGADALFLDGTFYANGEIPGRDMAEIPHPFVVETMRRLGPMPAEERGKVRFVHLNHTNPALVPGEARSAIEAAGFGVAFRGERIEI